MRTIITDRYTAGHPYAVVKDWGRELGGVEFLAFADCERCAREELAHQSRKHLGVEAVECRPVPTKGAHGGWRLGGGERRPCGRVPQMSAEDWPTG